MRAIIWAAVSTKPQVKKDSLKQQIEDEKAACERLGWDVVDILKVQGHTRSYIFFPNAAKEIEAYRKFKALCEQGAADVLVCRGRDRLGRTDALIAQVEALAREAGMQIYSMAMPTFVPESDKIKQDRGSLYAAAIERASAQAELVEFRRRHRQGMRSRIRKGLPAGPLPFGYRHDGAGSIPVQVPREVAIIRKMGELYLGGWGYPRIAGHLNEANISPPRADAWRQASVRRMLHNKFYAGWVFYGDAMAAGKHKPIWTSKEWRMIQQEHRRRKQTRGKQASPFSGLVRCSECGCVMVFQRHRKHLTDGSVRNYHYFRCREGHVRHSEHREGAHHNMIRVEQIRGAVLEKAKELQDPEVLGHACQNRAAEERVALERERKRLESALEEVEAEMERLIKDHARWGRIATEQFDEAMAEAAERKAELQDGLVDITIHLQEMPDPETRAEHLRTLASNVADVLDGEDVKEANVWLAKRVKSLWVKDGKVERVDLI